MCESEAKKTRQRIMAMASRLGWDSETAHELFAAWGYGCSLRKLGLPKLRELSSIIGRRLMNNRRKLTLRRGEEAQSLRRQIFWTKAQFEKLLQLKFDKSVWGELSEKQQKMVLAILRNYRRKRDDITQAIGGKDAS